MEQELTNQLNKKIIEQFIDTHNDIRTKIDALNRLKENTKLDDYYIPPVIALTANAMNGMREMYLKEGFADYISKPIKVEELERIINKYFGNRKWQNIKNKYN